MSQILLFSDIHIHKHKNSTSRLNDCLLALEWVFQTAVKRGITNILFLGDLFQDRQKIDVDTYQKTYETFEKYLSDGSLNVYMLLGNHDLFHFSKYDVSSIIPLRNLPGITIVDSPTTLTVEDHEISFLPYTTNPLENLKLIKNTSRNKILCGHVAVHGAKFNTLYNTYSDVAIEHDGEMVKMDTSIFAGWDHVFLGHYHGEQKLDYNVEYLGSPLQLSFGEAFQQKHIMLLDLDTYKKTYIRNAFSPVHLILKHDELNEHDLDNNFVIVYVDDVSSIETIELKKKLIENNSLGTLKIKPVEKTAEDQEALKDAKDILMDGNEMIKKYVEIMKKTDNLDGLNEDKLLEVGEELYECAKTR